MEFIDENHKRFWKEKNIILERYNKTDVYYKSLVYTLGICEQTREKFDSIFDIRNGEINIDSLQEIWQTTTSKRVTRMAFSLWNGCSYESEKDAEKGKISNNYNISDVFCCDYAPYFFEAIKIRYPENFREYQSNKVVILDSQKQNDDKEYGAYIRVNHCNNELSANIELEEKKEQILKYCKENNFNVSHIFCDIGFSGKLEKRISLKKLVEEVNKGKLKGIVAISLEEIIREQLTPTRTFLESIKGEIITVHGGKISIKQEDINKEILKDIEKTMQSEYKKQLAEKQKIGRLSKKRMQER